MHSLVLAAVFFGFDPVWVAQVDAKTIFAERFRFDAQQQLHARTCLVVHDTHVHLHDVVMRGMQYANCCM